MTFEKQKDLNRIFFVYANLPLYVSRYLPASSWFQHKINVKLASKHIFSNSLRQCFGSLMSHCTNKTRSSYARPKSLRRSCMYSLFNKWYFMLKYKAQLVRDMQKSGVNVSE